MLHSYSTVEEEQEKAISLPVAAGVLIATVMCVLLRVRARVFQAYDWSADNTLLVKSTKKT